MIGKPKYKLGDKVIFVCDFNNKHEELEGEIWVVDEFGTFDDPSDVSYDIFVKEKNCLHKHFQEKYVLKKIENKV